MQFKLFLLGAAVLPFITAAPVETGNDIAVRAETQDVSITVRKAEAEAAPEESGKKLAVRQTQRSQNVIAPSTLNLVSRTAMDGITFVMWYIGNNKYKIQVLSFINQSIAAYISDQNLAGLDVGAWPVAAQGHAFGEISGVNPGDVLTYTWKTNNREGQEVEDFPGFFLLAY